MNLLISLATRGRAAQCFDTIKRSVANWALPTTRMVVQFDADDTSINEAAVPVPVLRLRDEGRIVFNVAPREDTIAEKWNRILAEPADVYLNAADDDPYVTPGYDAKILDAAARFPDGIGVVYGHMANASFTGVSAHTAKWCEKLGGIYPTHFPYWFVDHWVDDVAKIVGRISFADVRTDQTKAGVTQEMREPSWWATWFDAAYLMRRSIAHDLIRDADFASPDWLKQLLFAHHPLIESRSRWVNDNVRNQFAAGGSGWAAPGLTLKDERYARVKQRALDLLPHLLGDYGMEAAEAVRFRNLLAPPENVVNLPRAFG